MAKTQTRRNEPSIQSHQWYSEIVIAAPEAYLESAKEYGKLGLGAYCVALPTPADARGSATYDERQVDLGHLDL
jgi:hypothetical protein